MNVKNKISWIKTMCNVKFELKIQRQVLIFSVVGKSKKIIIMFLMWTNSLDQKLSANYLFPQWANIKIPDVGCRMNTWSLEYWTVQWILTWILNSTMKQKVGQRHMRLHLKDDRNWFGGALVALLSACKAVMSKVSHNTRSK